MAENRDRPDFFTPFDLKAEETKPRRQILDRRGLRHGIAFTTTEATGDTEDWLDKHCKGKWSLELEEISDTLSRRSYLAMFELEADKLAFARLLMSRGGRRGGG